MNDNGVTHLHRDSAPTYGDVAHRLSHSTHLERRADCSVKLVMCFVLACHELLAGWCSKSTFKIVAIEVMENKAGIAGTQSIVWCCSECLDIYTLSPS